MKITRSLVHRFEEDQREHGTQTAIYNLLWKNASEQMNDLGVRSIATSEIPGGATSTRQFDDC